MARPGSPRLPLALAGWLSIGSSLVAAGCAVPSAPPPVAPRAVEAPAPDAVDPRGAILEGRLLALLADHAGRAGEPLESDDIALLGMALRFAAARARTIPAETLIALVRHRYPEVRGAALRAAQALDARGAIDREGAMEVYWRAALDPLDVSIRRGALIALGTAGGGDRFVQAHLRNALRDPDPRVARVASLALQRSGVDTGGLIVERFAPEPRSPVVDHLLVDQLMRSRAPGAADFLRWIATDSPNEHGAHIARAALVAREEAGGRIGPPPTHQPLTGDFGWRPVPEAALRERLRATRLAIFGEIHHDRGPLRETQCRALEHFAEGGGELVLGFEPSIKHTQQIVIDRAEELGFEVISTEPGIDVEAVGVLHHERDTLVARTVNARLAASPEARIFVVRGEGHLQPGGHLDALITEDTVLIHCGLDDVPLIVDDARLDLIGAIYASDVVDGLYTWFCYPYEATRAPEALVRALSAHDRP